MALGKSWDNDSDKPFFHVMPRDGWLNDPNGPIFYRGRYHVFYQHVIGSSTWDWGLVWGHASSANLVDWEHEPIAISPSPNGWDADGCWSGNTVEDEGGRVAMLYTGVRLRSKAADSPLPLPPPELDLGLEMIESQCAAQFAPGSDQQGGSLVDWTKLDEPILPLPPTGLPTLTGFRDPFVFARKTDSSPWKMIVGSGIKGQGGTILLYHSQSLTEGWEYQGQLEVGKSKPSQDGEGYDLGAMWECPFFVSLQDTGRKDAAPQWLLCVSPYPHHCTDRPTNPCLYWLGSFRDERFQMGDAAGPKLLDLGDVAYAPTIFKDGKGRVLMLAWLQELRKGGQWDYAGCLSAPRVLSLQDGRLRQDPAEELEHLRVGSGTKQAEVKVPSDQGIPLDGPGGNALDISLRLHRGSAAATGILLRAWLRTSQEGVPCAEALVLNWDKAELQVIAPDNLDAQTMTFDPNRVVKTIGGPILLPEDRQSLQLRILIDHSLVEVFTEFGQTLTTRVYRAEPPPEADRRLHLFSLDDDSRATDIEVHEMRSIWSRPEDIPEPAKVY